MTIPAARDTWSRGIARLNKTLTPHGHLAARVHLEAIRDVVALPERSRVDLYIELLEPAWDDDQDAGRRAGS
ncbi:MAG: hypothetical protein ACRDL8_11925 [Solirubrobacteraceae bacterium]